jgi:LacI family transcriptional regulator
LAKKTTIYDIASRAGVSYQTVSRVINDRPDVADTTRQRVLDIIKEMDYHPSRVARSLVSRETQTFGLLTNDFNDFFRTQVMTGADEEARKEGYAYILWSVNNGLKDEMQQFRTLFERQIDGVFVASSNAEHADHIQFFLDNNIPVVALGYPSPESFANIQVDNTSGAYRATEYLIQRGHRVIGAIAEPYGDMRRDGYRMALVDAGIAFDEALMEPGDWSFDSGYAAMKPLLERNPHMTAVFAQNDRMAIGAMHALHEAGLRIPDDIAVIGFDDIPAAAHTWPPLTTMRQPMRETGRIATQLLLEMVRNPRSVPKEVVLKTELVIRNSC